MSTASHDANELKRKMQSTLGVLKQEFSGLRTGRASANLLEPVQVDAYGAHMPLSQVATVSVPESRLLSVAVWDKGLVHAVEKAITTANLGLNPQTEGQTIRLRVPELNEERRKELVKVVKKMAEESKVKLRNARRDANERFKSLKKENTISEDEMFTQQEQVQKVTDKAIEKVDAMLAAKEKDIMQI